MRMSTVIKLIIAAAILYGILHSLPSLTDMQQWADREARASRAELEQMKSDREQARRELVDICAKHRALRAQHSELHRPAPPECIRVGLD
jgi:hypothetical protein